MSSTRAALGWSLLPAIALGCSPANEGLPESACAKRSSLGASTEPLIDGSSEALYLALSARERLAIGRIESETTPSICSGTRIAEEVALSASHCADLYPASFHDGSGDAQAVIEWIVHPELDVALARLEPSRCGDAATLPVAETERLPERIGRATLAGYGLTADHHSGELYFLVESVVTSDQRSVVVDGFGRSGACAGDSGGPLLIRDRSGRVGILGLLSTGDASCVGKDEYLRVDGLGEWLRNAGDLPPPSDACGGIDGRGRCFDDLAVWCEHGGLSVATCSAGRACGMSAELGGFRCTKAPLCAGDHFGRCVDGVALVCDEGGERASVCQSREADCHYEHQSGLAACL